MKNTKTIILSIILIILFLGGKVLLDSRSSYEAVSLETHKTTVGAKNSHGERKSIKIQPDANDYSSNDELRLREDDIIVGYKDAPVTIIEYFSLTCSHCAAFSNSVMDKLKTNYIDTNKVRFVLRFFPLDKVALRASVYVACVKSDESQFKFVKGLLKKQSYWMHSGDNLDSKIVNVARLYGVNVADFEGCINNEQLAKDIVKISADARTNLKVSSTPMFFVNGKTLRGVVKYNDFSKVIDSFLVK